jgi:hypothetical protein
MRRFLCTAAVLAAGVGAHGTAAAQTPAGDSVAGEPIDCIEVFEPFPGQIECIRQLALNIHVESGPAGENPVGTVSWSDRGPSPGSSSVLSAEPTCLSVADRVAIIGVTGTWFSVGLGSQTPIAGLIRVVDRGGPDSDADTLEFAFQTGQEFDPPLPGPTSCFSFPGSFPRNPSDFPGFSNETGDVVVVDTRPMPTTKDQCKNGRWATYGIFKNQGDCVSFVATEGKNPPSQVLG